MSEQDNPDFFDPVDEINKIISNSERVALPSIYEKVEKLDVVRDGQALVASANKKALPTRRVGRFEMLEVLERSLSRTVLNLTNPSERVFSALRELSDFLNMATTGSQPKVANAHRDLLPVGHPLSTREHNFSQTELAQFKAEWMSADPRIAEEFRPLVASAFIAPASSLEREYVIAKLEATSSTEVPRDVILGLTADADPYGGGNSFLARSARAKAQRRDRRGRFAYMGGGAKIWLGKQFSARSTLFRFAGYDSKTDSFDLEGLPNTPYQGKVVSVPASKVEAIKAILPELPGLKTPPSKSVAEDIIVDPSSLILKDAPTGWTKVSSENGVDTFRSADGWIATRYPNSASAPNEPSITRVRGANVDKSIDPDLPVYHIAKGSNDGLVTDKPFASTQSWGDTQALISRYDKKTDPKPKATLEEQPEEFLEGWTKGEGGYIPGKSNSYTEVSDRAGGKDFYTDPSGRYVAVKLATPPATWQVGAEQYKQTEDERTRKQVLESGLPIETFDGAQKWDGNVDNLYRLERVKSDGKRELLGFYQDPDDIEKDTEIPLTEDKSQDFYESVIADTLQNGGNTIDFVDGNWPEDGYIVAHEADILKQDGTLGKREELVTPEDFADPVEGPKRLRAFVLKNQDKLSQQGFYLGTWLDTVPVTDDKGNVVGEVEKVFLDVSEYEPNFDKAIDMAEARKEIAIYGVATYDKKGNKGTSLYVADEKRRREIVRKTPVFDKEEARRVSDEADRIIREEDKWFSDNNLEVQKTGRTFWVGRGDDAIPNPELKKDYPEIYRRLKRRFDAEKSRRSVFQNYIRSIFDMSDGMDPGGRNDGLSGESLRTRDNYVGRDRQTLEMNKALRDGGEVTSKVQKMDTLVKKSKVKDDTQFFRGAWLDPELVKDMGVGDMFFDRAFQSMGLEEATASSYLDFREKDFPNKSRVIFRLLLPKGMNAIHVGDDEVIARRNTKMRIIRKSELDGTTYFDVDVEPQTKEEIDARIQGRVPRPEESQDGTSSSELPANDGGGTDGLGNPSTLPGNYGPKPTEQGPDSERVTDPGKVIWDNLLEDVGIAEEDVIEEAINMMDSPERTARQMLKDQVATSLKEKLADVSDQEFVDLSLSGLSEFMDKKDFGFDGTRSIDLIGVIEMRKRNGRNIGRYTSIESLVTNGAVPRNFPKDLVDRLNTGKITRKDAEEVVKLLNEFRSSPPLPNENKLYIPSVDDKEFMDYLRYKTVSGLVGAWSSSSNGTNPLSLAIQSLAEKEFGIKGSAEWDMNLGLENEVKNVAKNNENIIRRFLRAQYDATQEYFQKKGISKVTLYRGIKEFIRHDIKDATFPSENGFVGSIKLRPLSSWTTSIGVANRFRNIDNGKMFRKEFDVKDIFSTPGTGVGCLPEEELVTLGGIVRGVDVSGDYKVEQLRVVFPSPEPQPITYKQAEPKINISNAPLLRGDFRDLTDEERAEIRRHNPATAIWVPIAEESTFYGKEIPSTLVNVLEQDKEAVRVGKLGGTFLGEEATIGLSRALKSGVAENLTEKLKDIGDKEFIDLAMAQGKKEINAGDKSAVESLRYQVVSDLIKSWAVTSNGDEPMSLAVQEIAKKEFGVETASNWDIDPEKQKQVDDIVKNNANLIRKFLRAQYDATQEYFKRKGITKLSLFRGVKKFDNHEMIEATFPNNGMFTATLGLRPLSSWSTSRNVAEIFANFHQQSRLFRKEFDVKDILCFPGTGFGCLDEKEMVVIGGNTKSIDVSSARLLNPIRVAGQIPFSFEKESENYQIVFKDDKKNPLDEPTKAGRPIGNWVNYAPLQEKFVDFTPMDIKPYLQKREEIRKEVTKAREEAEEFQKSIDSKAMLMLAKKTKDGSYIPNEYIMTQYGKNGKAMYAKVSKWLKLYDKLSDFDKKFLDSMFDRDSKAEDPSKDNDVFLWGMSDHTRRSWYSSGESKFNEVPKQEWQKQAFARVSRLISESSLKTDAELYRGEWLPKDLVESVAVGDTVYFDNIQELSYLPNVPQRQLNGTKPRYESSYLGEPKATSIKLNCPKGTNALYIGDQAYDWENLDGSGDGSRANQAMTRAVLLRPDVKMKLVSKTEKDGVTYLEFDVEPKTKEEIDNNISGLVKQGDEESAFQPKIPVNNAPVDLSKIPPDDGGDEPDPDEINIFDLENPDYSAPGFYKFEIAKNLAETDEMREVSDSEIVDLSDWFGLFSTDDIDWGEDEKKSVGSIKLLSLDQSEFGEGEWGGEYEFTDLLYDIEQNIRFGGVEPFKKGSVLKRVMDGYIAGEDPAISKEELAQFFKDYSKHFDEDITDSYLVPSIEDQQFMRLLREEVASNLIHVWAETSNGDHPMSHALQDIAKTVLGVEDSADWEDGKTQDQKDELFNAALDIKENYGEALRALVKAQYRLTQEWLEERGIEKLVVYRGIKEPNGVDNKKGLVQLRPLSSWSQSQRTALKFTGGTPNPTGGMLKTVIDAKDVFSTPFTGFGCLNEDEIVVIGGKKSAEMRPVKDVWSGWYDEPKISTNNAPISNAPKPMSNTERKRLERERRKAEEAAAPSPEEVKQQMGQAKQAIAEVAQVVPQKIDDLFDPNNPLNIVNARNITNDITGSTKNTDNLSKDEILRQEILFIEPTKEWEDLLDKVEQSGMPFAKEIISRLKRKHSRLIKDIEEFSLKELDIQRKYEASIKDLFDAVGAIVNNGLANPRTVPDMNSSVPILMRDLDDYFLNGNQSNTSLAENNIVAAMAAQMVYGNYAVNPQLLQDPMVRKAGADLISQFRSAYSRYPSPADRNALIREIQKIYIESSFGGLNQTNPRRTLAGLDRAMTNGSIPRDIARILIGKMNALGASGDELTTKKRKSIAQKTELAEKISEITKQVLSENGLEFDHGVTVSSSDINWLGVADMTGGATSNLTTGVSTPELQQIPDKLKNDIAPELKNVNGVVDIINKALQSYPRPVALALRNFLIDHKADMTFTTGTRGATGMLNLSSPDVIHDVGSLGLEVLKTMALNGREEKDAVVTTVHEMLHLIVNGIFRQEMNSIAWAKSSKETNIKDANGKVSNDFVDGNYGEVGYTMNGDYLSPDDIDLIIKANELGASSPNYASPYIGKYGNPAAVNVGLGQNPFAHGELLSTLVETLLGGGTGSMFSTWANPRRVRSGTNPDGSPRFITMDTDVFSEKMVPFGVSMVLLLNELAKLKLRIA